MTTSLGEELLVINGYCDASAKTCSDELLCKFGRIMLIWVAGQFVGHFGRLSDGVSCIVLRQRMWYEAVV